MFIGRGALKGDLRNRGSHKFYVGREGIRGEGNCER